MTATVSAIIALLLLLLYTYAVFLLVRAPQTDPTEQVRTVLSLVGGLVSALVVAILAIKPEPERLGRVLGAAAGALPVRGVETISWAYLLVWFGCGAVLLVYWMRTATPSQSLKAAATSWLGLAVAAAYAYLGLNPPS